MSSDHVSHLTMPSLRCLHHPQLRNQQLQQLQNLEQVGGFNHLETYEFVSWDGLSHI